MFQVSQVSELGLLSLGSHGPSGPGCPVALQVVRESFPERGHGNEVLVAGDQESASP